MQCRASPEYFLAWELVPAPSQDREELGQVPQHQPVSLSSNSPGESSQTAPNGNSFMESALQGWLEMVVLRMLLDVSLTSVPRDASALLSSMPCLDKTSTAHLPALGETQLSTTLGQ